MKKTMVAPLADPTETSISRPALVDNPSDRFQNAARRRWMLRSIFVALALFLSGEVGRLLAVTSTASPTPVTLFWPSSGVALGFALLYGVRIAPAIFVGILAEMLLYTPHFGKLATYTLADTATAVGTAALLKHFFDFDRRLSRVRDVVVLLLIGAVAMPIPQSLVEIIAYIRIEAPPNGFDNLLPYTFENWLQNSMAVLVFTPAMLALRPAELKLLTRALRFEALAITTLVFAITFFAHRRPTGSGLYGHLIAVAVFPFVILLVFRFGKAGAVMASLACAAGSVVAKSLWEEPVADRDLNISIIDQSAFLVIVAVVGLLLAVMLLRRITSELQLTSAEKSLRSLFELSPIGIVVELEGKVRFVNATLLQTLQRDSTDELIGRSAEDWLAVGSVERSGVDRAGECLLPDGTRIPVSVRETLIPRVEGVEVVRFIADRSQLARLEEELKQSRRMEGVGLLAGGVAHDFNNLLTVIAGYLDLMREPARGQPEFEQPIEQILSASQKASALTRQLLAFGRTEISPLEPLDLSQKVREFTTMLRRMLGERIEFVLELDDRMPAAQIDASQVDQILLNLVANARDAMPAGGTLTLRTRSLHVAATARTAEDFAAGDYAVLEVSDTGTGMDESTLRRAFEPFFTTKPLALGSGIGLASVRNIVDRLRGYVRVSSTPDVGTTITVALPLANGPIAAATVSQRLRQSQPGPRTVLVVQDLPELRGLLGQVLQREGFEVLGAASASEGLELLASHGGRCELMIADVLMPQMSGAELARCVRRHWPSIRTLFVSGYSEPELLAIRRENLSDQLLSKPFTLEQLRDRVRLAFSTAP